MSRPVIRFPGSAEPDFVTAIAERDIGQETLAAQGNSAPPPPLPATRLVSTAHLNDLTSFSGLFVVVFPDMWWQKEVRPLPARVSPLRQIDDVYPFSQIAEDIDDIAKITLAAQGNSVGLFLPLPPSVRPSLGHLNDLTTFADLFAAGGPVSGMFTMLQLGDQFTIDEIGDQFKILDLGDQFTVRRIDH